MEVVGNNHAGNESPHADVHVSERHTLARIAVVCGRHSLYAGNTAEESRLGTVSGGSSNLDGTRTAADA